MTMCTLLKADRLFYRVGTRTLLNEVSLCIEPGQLVGLVGPNGAGKTTLLRMLIGLRKPQRGAVTLYGKPLERYSARELARVAAYVQQQRPPDLPFSVREVVAMGRNPHVGRFQVERDHDRAAVDAAMEHMHVAPLAEQRVGLLSGGEQQRVMLARALAQEPQILLLDEPTSSLDVRHQIDILDRLKAQVEGRGLSALIAIHDLSLAASYCERLLLLHEGQILAEGKPQDVLTPQHLEAAFSVRAEQFRDPFTQALRLSIRG
jgi:iron complex transport system ATP-binding protein